MLVLVESAPHGLRVAHVLERAGFEERVERLVASGLPSLDAFETLG